MQIGLDDIHPRVGEILRARMWSLRFGHHARPEDAALRSVIARRWKGWGWRVVGAIPIGGLLGTSLALALGAHGGEVGAAAVMGAYFSALGTGVGSFLLPRFKRHVNVSAEELRALSTGLELGRPETIYLEILCGLADAGDNVSATTGREIIAVLNDLLEQSRYVFGRLERLRIAAGTESVLDLESERQRLAARIGEAHDEQARQDLTESLSICDERLRNARALSPLVERMDAQREMMEQTLLSVQSSVSRLQVAPEALAAPDVAEVKRVVSQVTGQTKAVEEAVQEVMSVSG